MTNFTVTYLNDLGSENIEAESFLIKEGFVNFYNSNNVVAATINLFYVLSIKKFTNG